MTASILNPNLSQGEGGFLNAALLPTLLQCGASGAVGIRLGGVGRAKFKREPALPFVICSRFPDRRGGEPRGMLTHRWLPLFTAWCEAGFAAADNAYENERARHVGDDNQDISALVRLADLISGRPSGPKAEQKTGVGA